jgi:hypothetical protein
MTFNSSLKALCSCVSCMGLQWWNISRFVPSIDHCLLIRWCRLFLGSVSNYCVHHCKCPVLVVKKQGWGFLLFLHKSRLQVCTMFSVSMLWSKVWVFVLWAYYPQCLTMIIVCKVHLSNKVDLVPQLLKKIRQFHFFRLWRKMHSNKFLEENKRQFLFLLR